MDTGEIADRRLDVLLERLDRIAVQLEGINRRLDNDEGLQRISRELATLNDSLQTLAYAAIGQQGPSVRRRRAG